MWKIQIIRCKPNPAGKDRNYYGPHPSQLVGEWVDLKNIGDTSVNLSIINLFHREFNSNCTSTGWGHYWGGNKFGELKPGQSLRIHTGKQSDFFHATAIDRTGVDMHQFAERSQFALNNRCGDTISVDWRNSEGKMVPEDSATYHPNPPEGAVLIRSGELLIPEYSSAYR